MRFEATYGRMFFVHCIGVCPGCGASLYGVMREVARLVSFRAKPLAWFDPRTWFAFETKWETKEEGGGEPHE